MKAGFKVWYVKLKKMKNKKFVNLLLINLYLYKKKGLVCQIVRSKFYYSAVYWQAALPLELDVYLCGIAVMKTMSFLFGVQRC